MKPSQITQIIIRLFAISWFLHGIVLAVGMLSMSRASIVDITFLLPGFVAFALSLVAWFLAPWLARLIAKENDREVVQTEISFPQLLHAMLLGIGLFFAIKSVGGLLNSLHFFLVLRETPESLPAGMTLSVYDVSASLVTFGAGAFLVATARHWSKKITAK